MHTEKSGQKELQSNTSCDVMWVLAFVSCDPTRKGPSPARCPVAGISVTFLHPSHEICHSLAQQTEYSSVQTRNSETNIRRCQKKILAFPLPVFPPPFFLPVLFICLPRCLCVGSDVRLDIRLPIGVKGWIRQAPFAYLWPCSGAAGACSCSTLSLTHQRVPVQK